MSAAVLSTGDYAVLGVLRSRPMHGYEMARRFDRGELCEVLPIDQSMLYAHVRKLEERGLVTWAEERVGLRPPRKKYSLTDEGRALLTEWLRTPVQRMREIRLEFLLKLYFLHEIDGLAEFALLVDQIAICGEYRDRLGARVANSRGFPRLVANSKYSASDATLKWLRQYADELSVEGAAR